jgi:hypothetical protein
MTLDNPIEPFVDANKAAEFLAIKPRRVLDLAREGKLPAHPIGDGPRRTWRFLVSELAVSMGKKLVASGSTLRYGSSQAASASE